MNSQSGQPQARHRKRLTPEQRRRIAHRQRMQKLKQLLMMLVPALVIVIAVTVLLTNILGGKKNATDATIAHAPEQLALMQTTPQTQASAAATQTQAPAATTQAPVSTAPAVTATATVSAQSEAPFSFDTAYADALKGNTYGREITFDTSKIDPSKLNRWPEAKEGYLPIVRSAANVTEKIICVTIDDCYQAANLAEIVKLILQYDGKATIFPIGANLEHEKTAQVIKEAWESGMEIENHTYDHVGMYGHDDEYMTNEMWYQNVRLSMVLGVNYQEHFFRPRGGDERYCQRMHAYSEQLGFNGVAMWTQTGSISPMADLIKALAPGEIYLFHTTDNDLQRLREFIPAAAQAGYKLVTMNEMFGLPDNETSDISTIGEKPALQSFQVKPAEMKKTMYLRAAAIVQKRLRELGWLKAEADGIFGKDSYMAIGYFQKKAGLEATGTADAATQAALFADNAPRKS